MNIPQLSPMMWEFSLFIGVVMVFFVIFNLSWIFFDSGIYTNGCENEMYLEW